MKTPKFPCYYPEVNIVSDKEFKRS